MAAGVVLMGISGPTPAIASDQTDGGLPEAEVGDPESAWHGGGVLGLAATGIDHMGGFGSGVVGNFMLGAWLDRAWNRFVSTGVALTWSRKGADDGGDVAPVTTERIAVDYLEVPLLVRLGVPGRRVRPHLLFGAASALRVRSRQTIGLVGGDPGTDVSHSTGFDDHVRWFDVGTVAGLGVDFGAVWRFRIELAWTTGLVDAFPDHRAGANHAVTLSLGLGR